MAVRIGAPFIFVTVGSTVSSLALCRGASADMGGRGGCFWGFGAVMGAGFAAGTGCGFVAGLGADAPGTSLAADLVTESVDSTASLRKNVAQAGSTEFGSL
ncbi:hypothetical protein PA05_1549 [Cutibacterium acnes P05]|nr:hypothetical protein [Cutibacterium acnes P05]